MSDNSSQPTPALLVNARRSFLFDGLPIRGHLVQLSDAWQQGHAHVAYPDPVRRLLGQAWVAVALMGSTIKFNGAMALQCTAEHAGVPLLLVQATNDGALRGLARWEDDRPLATFAEQLGGGQAAITLEREGHDQYQGIVPLAGESLAECVEGYFQQSEQLPTRLWLAADGERAAGLLLQRLPGELEDADAFNRVCHLADTVTDAELQDLPAEHLLQRLFHEETLRLLDPVPLRFACRCSRGRIADMIRGMGEPEANAIVAEQNEIAVTCEFCAQQYRFDAVDVAQLFASPLSLAPSSANN